MVAGGRPDLLLLYFDPMRRARCSELDSLGAEDEEDLPRKSEFNQVVVGCSPR